MPFPANDSNELFVIYEEGILSRDLLVRVPLLMTQHDSVEVMLAYPVSPINILRHIFSSAVSLAI
jgi:hypothetical protein